MGENVLEQSIQKPSGPLAVLRDQQCIPGGGVGGRLRQGAGGERDKTRGEEKHATAQSKCRLDKSRKPLLDVTRLLHKRQAQGGRTDQDHIWKVNSRPGGLISSCAVRELFAGPKNIPTSTLSRQASLLGTAEQLKSCLKAPSSVFKSSGLSPS